MNIKFVLLLSLISFNICNSQNIKGYIYNKENNEPLIGASIYFNNTTIGVVTNKNGYFEIEKKRSVKVDLVVEFLGFETKIINDINYDEVLKIYLSEKSTDLNEVIVTYNDPLTRKQKLRMFKKGFLGTLENNERCTIINEDDLILRYNAKNRTLTVYSKKPIVVLNKYLGYKLEYSLIAFFAEYGRFSSRKVTYSGTTKYIELSHKKKFLKNRKKAYLGSILHLMRSLYANELTYNKFGIIKNGMIVSSNSLFTFKKNNKFMYIETKKDTINIVYIKKNNNKQSLMIIESKKFMIDEFGNFSANPQLLFGGDMGKQKVCQMLPLDYVFIK